MPETFRITFAPSLYNPAFGWMHYTISGNPAKGEWLDSLNCPQRYRFTAESLKEAVRKLVKLAVDL